MKPVYHLIIALGMAAAPFSHAEESWQKLDSLFPALQSGSGSFTTDNKLTSRGGIVTGGGPAAGAVSSNFGSSEAGWWWGVRASSGGTAPSFNIDTQTLTVNTSNGAKGSFIAAKSGFLSANDLAAYKSLKFSIDFGSVKQGNGTQGWNLSLWYSLGEESSVTKIGNTITDSGDNLAGLTQSWNLDTNVLDSLAENGGHLYLVINSHDNPNGYHELEISGIKLEGLVPEPATASLGLLGFAALMMRRRKA